MKQLISMLLFVSSLFASVNLQIAELEAKLIENETDHKARLDLAKLYFEMGMFKESKANFETVLATEPPEQVKRNIEFFLSKIESYETRSRLSLFAEVGAGQDSNVNAHPGEAKLMDYMVSDLGYSADGLSLSDKVASAFMQESLSGRYAYDFGRRGFWGAEVGAFVYNQSFDEAGDFDILFREATLGASYRQPAWSLSLPISKGMMDYGGKGYMDIDSFSPLCSMMPDPLSSVALQAVWRTKKYEDSVYSGRDSEVTGGSISYSRIVGSYKAGVGAGIEKEAVLRDGSEVFVDRGQQELRLNLATELFDFATLNMAAFYRDIRFSDAVDATTPDKRNDRFALVSAAVQKPFGQSFAANLKANYSRNDSNYKPATYDKTQVLFSLNYFYGGL